MKWLITRGARFYDVMGILQLALSVESLMSGISRVNNWNASLSCFAATIFWVIAGWSVLEVAHVLQVYEAECMRNDIFSTDEVYNLMVERQAHISTTKRIILAFILSLFAIFALILANLLTKS